MVKAEFLDQKVFCLRYIQNGNPSAPSDTRKTSFVATAAKQNRFDSPALTTNKESPSSAFAFLRVMRPPPSTSACV